MSAGDSILPQPEISPAAEDHAFALLVEFKKILDEGRYAIRDAPTLRGVHEDAFLLYDIVNGKRPIGVLLDAFRKVLPPPIFDAILVDLYRFLEPRLAEVFAAMHSHSEDAQ